MAGEAAFFELGVEDTDKGRAFYEGLFGWTFQPGPSGSGWMIGTPGIAGGMHGGDKGASAYVFFAVDDIDAAVEKVAALGGETLDIDIDGDDEFQGRYGRFRLCTDDQGSGFGLHQPA